MSSLRAFEAAARTGSFSAAGRELNVTHAAISQHVRGLEARLGVSLLSRDGQRLVPTDDGRELGDALSTGFGHIVTAVETLTKREAAKPLRVSLTPAFAEAWLMPRIGGFWAAHPDIPVELAPTTGVVDLLRDRIDLAIRHGRGDWPGLDCERILPSRYAVVAAKGLRPPVAGDSLSELEGSPWVLEHLWPEGKRWFSENGIDITQEKVTLLGTISLTLQAVREGHGISIVPTPIAEREARGGSLDILYEAPAERLAYYLVTRPGTDTPARRKFIRWIKAEANA